MSDEYAEVMPFDEFYGDQPEEEVEEVAQDPLQRLMELAESDNIAAELEDYDLGRISDRVRTGMEIDEASRSEWMQRADLAMKLATQVLESKSYPWENAANIKYPLVTTAAIQFAARAYPALVPPSNPVKGKVIGSDEGIQQQGPMTPMPPMPQGGTGQPPMMPPSGTGEPPMAPPASTATEMGAPPSLGPVPQQPQQQQWQVPPGAKREKADRIAEHMSYQLYEEMPEWDEDTDKLLHILPILGLCYRKVYFDGGEKRNVSCLRTPARVIVHYWAESLDRAPRISEKIYLYPYEVIERQRDGRFLDVELDLAKGEDEDAPVEFIEQHCRLDLDEDGYGEPYVVTMHVETGKIVRIKARFYPEDVESDGEKVIKIKGIQYYVKYSFLPAPDGSFYDLGLGILLGPINHAINSSINQMLDAGHIQNVGGGFISAALRIRGGQLRFKPGEYKNVNVPAGATMAASIYQMQHAGPSPVLFNLLGLLIEAGKDISSVKDVLTGEAGGKNESPTTVMARIEQGLKVFSSIYKRIFRSMKAEFGLLAQLNSKFLDEDTYYRVLDEGKRVGPQDYNMEDLDVVPVADPAAVTDMVKMVRAEFLQQFLADPHLHPIEMRRRILQAAGIEDVNELLEVPPPPPDPMIMKQQHEATMDMIDRQMDMRRLEAELVEIESKIIKNLADAESKEAGQQMAIYKAELDTLKERVKADAAIEQERIRSMAQRSGNQNGGGGS